MVYRISGIRVEGRRRVLRPLHSNITWKYLIYLLLPCISRYLPLFYIWILDLFYVFIKNTSHCESLWNAVEVLVKFTIALFLPMLMTFFRTREHTTSSTNSSTRSNTLPTYALKPLKIQFNNFTKIKISQHSLTQILIRSYYNKTCEYIRQHSANWHDVKNKRGNNINGKMNNDQIYMP